MTETEFLARWHAERDTYAAWGEFVRDQIVNALGASIHAFDAHAFLKILPTPRTKTDDSLLGKAFHRNKPYADPYGEIEDKVGVRFVVLLTSDIRKIQDVIEASSIWTLSLDRDYEAEREEKPLEFTYQSKHYVLKAARDVDTSSGIIVPKDAPCEVQLRTLLQHAHSELTHDNIYKREPGTEVAKSVERTIAKSMALIEAVDDYFIRAVDDLALATKAEREAVEAMSAVYRHVVGVEPRTDLSNRLVLQAYKDHLGAELGGKLQQYLADKQFIAEHVRERAEHHYVFRQPWILLAYMLASASPAVTAERWPLTPEELRPVYTDLGLPFPA